MKNILDEVIVHVEQRFKSMEESRFVVLLYTKHFHTFKKYFPMEMFPTLGVHKDVLDLDGLKSRLKSVYPADFAKHMSSICDITEIK